MKKILTVILIGAILLTCKKSKKTTEPKTNLDQQTAQAIAEPVVMGTGEMFKSFFNPVPDSMKYGTIKQDCINVTPQNPEDKDGDGYPKEAIYELNCEFGDYVIKGKIIIQDKDDNDPTSGFYVEIDNLTYSSQQISFSMDATYDVRKTQTSWDGHIKYSFTYNEVSWGWEFDFTYKPDNQNNPYEAGEFNFEGKFSVSYQNNTYSLSVRGDNIHYSSSSNCPYPDQGTLRITDGTNNLVITFSCDSYVAEYNGIPVGPASY